MNSGRMKRCVALGVAGVALAGAVAVLAVAAARYRFVGSAMAHPLFIRCGLIAAGCLIVLVAIGLYMQRVGSRGLRASAASEDSGGVLANEHGTAMVEFALVFPLAMSVVLILIQAMLMMTAAIVVNYAAYAAARTAIVWVPEDLYGGDQFVAERENEVADSASSRKRYEIRKAAVVACLPVAGRSPSGDSPASRALADGIAEYHSRHSQPVPRWVESYVAQKMAYAWQYTTATLFAGQNPGVYGPAEDLTVEVRHEYLLPVPFADRLFGENYVGGLGYTSTVTAQYTLNNEGESPTIMEDQFPTR